MKRWQLAVIMAVCVFGVCATSTTGSIPPNSAQTAQDRDTELGTLVLSLINVANPKLSPARKQIITRTFVRVTKDILEKQEDRREFAFVILAESSYNPDINDSSAGAVGLSQLLPQYGREFSARCRVPAFTTDDLRRDVELNLTVGACLFRYLTDQFNGNAALAHAAYIAGANSLAVKQLQQLNNVTDPDVAKYLAKFFYLKEATKSGPIKGYEAR